jgi:hypothetical protein
MATGHISSPLSETDALEARKLIIDFWNGVAQGDYLGGILGELVREKEIEVTRLLETHRACDTYAAWRITIEVEALRRSVS